MKLTIYTLAALAGLSSFQIKLAFARITVPVTQWTDCVSDQCTSSGGSKSCLRPNKCSTSSGCWPGSTDACCPASNFKPQVIEQSTKGYRLKSATGYNAISASSSNFSAVNLLFSAIEPGSGLPDVSYLLGSRDKEVVAKTKTITFVNEIVGIKLVWSNTPDWEGITFLETDGTMQRIGEDTAYTPVITDFTRFDGRLIGLTGKFY